MTEQAQPLINPVILRLRDYHIEIDRDLPRWARRTHPIVRQQLGIYWKALPLPTSVWLRLLVAQAVGVLATLAFPSLLDMILPLVVVSAVTAPMGFLLYLRTLYCITEYSADAMLEARQSGMLPLLLVTPIPARHVIFGKIAASLWRQLDNLSLVFVTHVLFGLPLLIVHYVTLYPVDESPLLARGAIIAALFVNMGRIAVESVLVSAVGLLVGALIQPRILAVIVAVTLSGFYFVFLNLPRLIDLPVAVRLLLELGLPLLLPLGLVAAAVGLTLLWLQREHD